MDIYNKLPNELKIIVSEYTSDHHIPPLLKQRNALIKALGKWTGKSHSYIGCYYKKQTSKVKRTTIYNIDTEKGKENYIKTAEKFEELVERTIPLLNNSLQVTYCCIKFQHEENIVRCPNNHPYCKHRPFYQNHLW